jgi:hypothetical protein
VRVAAAGNRLLALPDTSVRDLSFELTQLMVTVALRRHRLACADCSYLTRPATTPHEAGHSWLLADHREHGGDACRAASSFKRWL